MRRIYLTLFLAAAIIVSGVGFAVASYLHKETIHGVVTDKYTKRSNEHDNFYVVLKQDDGAEKVLQNTDSFLMFKFDSADVQAKIHKGEKYEMVVRGYRLPILSMFPNVASVQEVRK